MPACDDFTTFSNLLFDPDYNFSSSDDKLFLDKDISKKIYSNPQFDEEIISMKIDPHHFNAESDLIESLLNHDSMIISSSLKIDSLFDEFAGELTLLKSISSGIDETDYDPEEEIRLIEKLLYDNPSPRPLEEFKSKNSDATIESFSPSPIPIEDSDSLMEEIDLSFTPDDSMPPGIEEDDYDSERDMLVIEELLSNNSLTLPERESIHFDIPSSSRPSAKPPDDDSGILTIKVVDDILPTQPTLVSNQEKSPNLLSHQGLKAFQLPSECPMMIYRGNTPILDDNHLVERLLYDKSSPRPPEEFVSENSNANIESFSPSPIPVEDSDSRMEEIDLTFTLDDPMPPIIEEDDYDSKRDILILEELPNNYSFSLHEIKSFYFDIPSFSCPPAKPPDGNTRILNIKMMGDVSNQKVPIHGLTITRVSNQEKSPDLLSHRGFENFQLFTECPMMIHGKNIPVLGVPLFHFYPLDQFKYGGIRSS
nr:hypothetical protein [Tanacetum cinerariifolium]